MRSIILIIVLFPFSVAFAIEDSRENRSLHAERYLASTPPREMLIDMTEQIAKTLPSDKQAAFKKALIENMDVDRLSRAMKDAMVKSFTADELKALADFYGSPVGKSAMKKFGTYMAEVMPAVQAEVARVVAALHRDLSEEMR